MSSRVIPGQWNGGHAALSSLCSLERACSSPSSGTTRMWWNRRHARLRSICHNWREDLSHPHQDCDHRSVARVEAALDLESSAFGLGDSTPFAPTKDVRAWRKKKMHCIQDAMPSDGTNEIQYGKLVE